MTRSTADPASSLRPADRGRSPTRTDPSHPSRGPSRPAAPNPMRGAVLALALAIEAALPFRAAGCAGAAGVAGVAGAAGAVSGAGAAGCAGAAGGAGVAGSATRARAAGDAEVAGAAIRPADAAGLPSREEMAGWHRGYEPRAAPVRQALVAVLRARHEPRPSRWEPGVRRSCGRLARELGRFGEGVAEGEVFPVPYRPADYHLKRAYASLDEAARACLAGRYGAMEGAIHRSLGSMRQAEAVLWRRYRLRP